MTRVVEVPFGEWLPDAPSFKNPGCEEANNVIPVTGGYDPFPSLEGQGETVTGTVKGAVQMYDNTGTSIIVGGTNDRLFIRRSSITQTTGFTALGGREAWDFAQFNDFVIAAGSNNTLQYLSDIDVDNTWSALSATAPSAKRVARVGDFVMAGNIDGAPNRIQWGPINNPTGVWTASRLTQAGQVDLPPEYGAVQKIVGGRYALVFQERAIHRLTYVGPPLVWRADVVSDARGALAPFSVITIAGVTYYLSQDGWRITNGSEEQPLGSQRINRWFIENVDFDQIAFTQGAIDWGNEAIVWAFTGLGSLTSSKLLIYSYSQNRFSTADANVDWICGSNFDGVDLDSLDAIYGNLDAIPGSLDVASLSGGDRVLSGFVGGASTSEYSIFNGTAQQAVWETGEFQISPQRRSFVNEVTALMEAEDWDMRARVNARNNLGVRSQSRNVQAGWNGACAVRTEGQKISVRVEKPSGGTWSKAQGIQVRFKEAGYR